MQLLLDMRFALQALRRSPGFALLVAATLAVGIGANGGIFSVVNGVLLDAVPFEDSGRLVHVDDYPAGPGATPRGLTAARAVAIREHAESFVESAAVGEWGVSIGDEAEGSAFASAAVVSPSLFQTAGIEPALGRSFDEADVAPGADPVTVLHHTLWKTRFGGDPAIIGRQIEIDGYPVRVVGVLAEGAWLPLPWSELLVPLRLDAESQADRDAHWLGLWARLAPGASIESARAELEVLSAGLARQHAGTDGGWVLAPRPLRDRFSTGRTRRGVVTLALAVGLVLLLACSNLASLLLARGIARQGELAVRSALGASRGQLARQLLAESLVLALLALPFAIWISWAIVQGFQTFPPANLRYVDQVIRFDASVVAFVSALALATVALFGLGPAVRVSRVEASQCLAEAGSRSATAGGGVGRQVLVVVQIALGVSLLACAQLAAQGLTNLRQVEPGFASEGLYVASFRLPNSRYPDAEARRRFRRNLLERLERVSEVEKVALTNWAPLSMVGAREDFEIPSQPRLARDEAPQALLLTPTAEYFEVLRMRVLEGRAFTRFDRPDTEPVAVVSASLAWRYFGDEGAVGEMVRVDGTDRRVVGVVGDVRHWGPAAPVEPALYLPHDQRPSEFVAVLMRARGSPKATTRLVRLAVLDVDRRLAGLLVAPMTERLEFYYWQARLFAAAMGSLAGLALALAAFGVYGVVSYSVAGRRRELGIRSALGATPGSLFTMVALDFGRLAAAGIAVGLFLAVLGAAGLTRVLTIMDPWRPGLFAGAALALLAAAIVGGAVPTARAALTNPRESLEA